MNPANLLFLIALAIIICPSEGNENAKELAAHNQGLNYLSSNDTNRMINESNIILGSIGLLQEPSPKDELFLIGEVAISSILEKMANLSSDNQSAGGVELVETRDLAIFYSDMSHSLGIERIPIILARLDSQKKAIPIGNLTEERAMINKTTIREDLFQPSQPVFTLVEISEGSRQSSSGGDVVWI